MGSEMCIRDRRGAYPDESARANAVVANRHPVVVSHGFQDDPTFFGGSSSSAAHPDGQLAVPKRQSFLSSEDNVYHIKDLIKVEVGKLPSSASEFLDWGMCLTTSVGRPHGDRGCRCVFGQPDPVRMRWQPCIRIPGGSIG